MKAKVQISKNVMEQTKGISAAKGKAVKITVEAIKIKADGTQEDLGVISESKVKL